MTVNETGINGNTSSSVTIFLQYQQPKQVNMILIQKVIRQEITLVVTRTMRLVKNKLNEIKCKGEITALNGNMFQIYTEQPNIAISRYTGNTKNIRVHAIPKGYK